MKNVTRGRYTKRFPPQTAIAAGGGQIHRNHSLRPTFTQPPGKWTVKESIVHLIDWERIFVLPHLGCLLEKKVQHSTDDLWLTLAIPLLFLRFDSTDRQPPGTKVKELVVRAP